MNETDEATKTKELNFRELKLCLSKPKPTQFSIIVPITFLSMNSIKLNSMVIRSIHIMITICLLNVMVLKCVSVAHQRWCRGFRPGSGLTWLLPRGIPQRSIHRVSWPWNLQLLCQLLQLLARHHRRQ